MDDFRTRWDALSADSPTATERAWEKVCLRTANGGDASWRPPKKLRSIEEEE